MNIVKRNLHRRKKKKLSYISHSFLKGAVGKARQLVQICFNTHPCAVAYTEMLKLSSPDGADMFQHPSLCCTLKCSNFRMLSKLFRFRTIDAIDDLKLGVHGDYTPRLKYGTLSFTKP